MEIRDKIFETLFDSLKGEPIRPAQEEIEIKDYEPITYLGQYSIISKGSLEFLRKYKSGTIEYEIKANNKSILFGLISDKIEFKYHDYVSKMLHNLWDNLEEYSNMQEAEYCDKMIEEIEKAIK